VDATNEIRENLRCLDTLRNQLENSLEWPVCRQKHVAIDNLFQNHFFELGENAYGEDNTLLWQWKLVSTTIDSWNRIDNNDKFRTMERNSEISLRDIYFQQAFIIWYLSPHIEGRDDSNPDYGDRTPQSCTGMPDAAWDKWEARVTIDYDKNRVANFGDWLALLD